MLRLDGEVVTPSVGRPYPDVDAGLFRRCLGYTDSFYVDYAEHLEVNIGGGVIKRALPFHPPASGSGKWHIAFGDIATPPSHWPDNSKRAACFSPLALDFNAEPVVPELGTAADDRRSVAVPGHA